MQTGGFVSLITHATISDMSVTISKTTKTYPRLPYEKMAATILGKNYEVSLVFLGEQRAQTLNKTTRNKPYHPNVLPLPLTTAVGEIYLTPQVAKREAKQHSLSYTQYIGYLFIHGCLHLKGLDHGARMDTLEAKYCKQFKIR